MEKWMPHGPSGHLRTGMLLSVLFVAVVLRIYNLNIVEPQMPVLTADALEYKIYGQYLVSGDYEKPLADRPPAFPLVLGLLYSVLEVEGNKAWPQRLLTVLFDIATCAMLYAVVERICGGWTALLAAALYASNGELIRNSLLASTEQFYMLVSLAIFYGFQRLSKSPLRWSFVLIATGCAFLILTKQEGFLIIGAHFIFAIFSIRRFDIASHRGQWLGIAGAVITSITAYASYKYYSAYMLQIPTMNYRTGNALFHAEFLSYRLPWGYMRDLRNEYFRMSNVDWLLNYHSLEQVLSIVADSTLLVFIYFGEMLGAIPLIALVVASVYLLWREGQLQLPFLLSLSLLPFCFLAEPHSQSSYTPRLLVPAMPYALSLLAIFSLWLVRQVKVRWGALTALCCGMGMLVLYAVLNLGAVHALGINPAVRHVLLKKGDGEFTRPSFDLDEKINEGMWWQIRKDYDRSRAAFHAVLEYYPNYAPAHLGLAYNDLAQGS
jgi:4-amino-4-deoxy-L-arabinose transferase-like glycosyltransferase